MTLRDLIDALGGSSAVARELGVSQQAVTNMKARNALPPRHLLTLWRLAKEKGVDWTPPGAPSEAA